MSASPYSVQLVHLLGACLCLLVTVAGPTRAQDAYAPPDAVVLVQWAIDKTTSQGVHVQFPYHPLIPKGFISEKAHAMVKEEIEEMLDYIETKGMEYLDDKRKFGLIAWGKVGVKIGQIIKSHQKLQAAAGVHVPLGKDYCRSAVRAVQSAMNKSGNERDRLIAAKAEMTLDDLRAGLHKMIGSLKEAFDSGDVYCFVDFLNGKIDGEDFDVAVGRLMGGFEYLDHAAVLPIVRRVIGLTVNLCQECKKCKAPIFPPSS